MNKIGVKTELNDNKLPEGWKRARLGKVLKYEQPYKYIVKNTQYEETGIPVLTAGKTFILGFTVEEDGIYTNLPVIIFDDFTTESKYIDFPFKVKSSAMKFLKKKDNNIVLKFVFENMQLVKFPSLGGDHKRRWISEFQYFQVPLPPLTEQRKITEILETVDETIEKTDAIIEKYKRIKQGLMQDLLTRGIDENGQIRSEETHKFKDSPIGRTPEEWEVMEIKKIAEQVHLKNFTNFSLPVLSCTKYNGLVDSLEYFKKQIFSNDISKYKIVKRRQFAYATNHLEEGAIGYQDIYNLAVISPMYTVFETSKEYINDNFLFRVLKTEKYRLIYESKTEASVNRRGGLRWKYFSEIKIPVPSLPEQQRITSNLSQIDEIIEKEQKYKEKLERIKQGLMEDLLTGKVRVLNVNYGRFR